jgi:hypothetical protein
VTIPSNVRILLGFLVATVLVAQTTPAKPGLPLTFNLNRPFAYGLGGETADQFQLAAPGWSLRILQNGPIRQAKGVRKGTPGATVEIWDYALPEFENFEQFLAFKERLNNNLRKAFLHAPMDYAAYDLALLMNYVAAKGSAAGIDMINVQNMLSRYGSANPAGIRTPSTTDAPAFMGRRR